MMLGKICRLSFLVVVALSLIANDKAMVAGDDPQKCPDRSHIIKCAEAHLDTNKNGKLDREELEAAIDSLPWCVNHVSCASVATRNALFLLLVWFHMFYNYFLERVVYHFSFFRSNTEFTCWQVWPWHCEDSWKCWHDDEKVWYGWRWSDLYRLWYGKKRQNLFSNLLQAQGLQSFIFPGMHLRLG